ncbi:MAG: hypothetical protein KF715_10665 [Candidatus Didemnitutus sp.]|nr:hypothetical protein [Candidatus Didemnitutus sp.]
MKKSSLQFAAVAAGVVLCLVSRSVAAQPSPEEYRQLIRNYYGAKEEAAKTVKLSVLNEGGNKATDQQAAEQKVAEAEKKLPLIDNEEITTMLRARGFGITGGYGQLTRSSNRLTTFQLRYNIFGDATRKANNRRFPYELDKQVAPAGGAKILEALKGEPEDGAEPDMSDLPVVARGAISGIYLWAGWTDKEVTIGTETARPVLAGVSVGFGPLEKAASAVHLDVGLAFYGNSKMPKDDIYVGVSVDLELFKKLLKSF